MNAALLRPEHRLIADWIGQGSRVLDLGCGDGAFLAELQRSKGVTGYGIEIDPDNIVACLARGVNVIQATGGAEATYRVKATDHLYRALVLPLVEFVTRMGWSLMLVLALVLTYRITDSVWGVFAYPFYLGELGFTAEDVAFASKILGIFAILIGLALPTFLGARERAQDRAAQANVRNAMTAAMVLFADDADAAHFLRHSGRVRNQPVSRSQSDAFGGIIVNLHGIGPDIQIVVRL